ncbi:MAG TPA: protein kinase, partial [Myxococcus sp.]|nr:protein kinase [Myxococcus sp.]
MSPAPSETPGWSPPSEFEEYRLVRLLGRGAMGEVHLAHDVLLDRPVAIKFISGVQPGPHARARFFSEARALARLLHPNVLAIHRVGEHRGRPYLVSEFIRGDSLDTLPLPLPWERVVQVGMALARGLAAAHRVQVLHRDIKPANILLTGTGEVKLVDFGLALRLDEADVPAVPTPPRPGAALGETQPLPGAPPAPPQPEAPEAPGGDFAGTPRYMAPELWRGEPATCQSDVYALGAVLYELCAGQPPHTASSVEALGARVQSQDAPPLAGAAPGLPPRLCALVDSCLRRESSARPASADAVRDVLEQLHLEHRPLALPEGNPYRGLRAFGPEHRAVFFGRGAAARAVLERLRAEPFVLVAGDSGVGKSSLCHAAVVPMVEEGALGDGAKWACVRVTPGRFPLQALAAVLARLLPEGEERLVELLRAEPGAVARLLRRRPPGEATLLFVDQLEELWTLSEPTEADRVRELLAALALRSANVRLLGTLRSDFLTRFAARSGLGEELTQVLYLLRPLDADGVREAILGPAHARGFRFEAGALVEQLAAAATRSSGSLPLVQFALGELWEARDEARRVIPLSALERMGGVEAALARHADGVLASLPPPERACARAILTALVTAEGTRARRPEAELAPSAEAQRALQTLVRGRLLVAQDTDGAAGAAYEISHEALLTGWDTLRGWLGRDVEARALRQRLERAATEWERLGRGTEALWGERQLAEVGPAGEWEPGGRERAFLQASWRQARRRRWGRRALVLAVPLLVGLAVVGVRLRARAEVDRAVEAQRRAAAGALDEAARLTPRLEALRQEAFGLFDRGARDEAEGRWATARALAGDIDAAHWRASRALESALLLDPGRGELRERFADLTLARLLAAERAHHEEQRAELLERLRAYDTSGERLRWLEAPAALTVTSLPGAARVSLRRYDAQGRLQDEELAPGAAPLTAHPLPPGSYLLELRHEGYAPVRLPLVARRGERLSLRLPLPRADALPPGFLYVPEGAAALGFAGDEDVRRGFFGTAPLHEVRTGPYLIGRTEVTFAEWLEYLRALPPAERARRMPRGRTLRNSLELRERAPGRFELTFQPTIHAYRAAEGEPLRY